MLIIIFPLLSKQTYFNIGEFYMNSSLLKDEKKLNNIKTFISVTRDIIKNEGINRLSTRKISSISGLHNSTIYLYFDNLTELILLSCITYFDGYSKALKDFSDKHTDTLDTFIGIWDIFMSFALKDAEVFDYFFFKDENFNLEELFHIYYNIFPDEIYKFSDIINTMYYGKNIYDRSIKILLPLLGCQNCSVTKKNIYLINELIISYLDTKLKQSINKKKNNEVLKAEFLLILKHIIGLKE